MRLPRYRLSTLILMVAAASILFFTCVYCWRSAEHQRNVVREIQASSEWSSAWVTYDYKYSAAGDLLPDADAVPGVLGRTFGVDLFHHVVGAGFTLDGPRDDKLLRDVAKLDKVKWLFFNYVGDDNDLEPLRQMTQLEDIHGLPVQALQYVDGLSGLSHLVVSNGRGYSEGDGYLTESEEGHLAHLTSLRSLTMSLTGDELRVLRDMTHLEELVLQNCKIGDSGLAHMTELPSLTRLTLTGAQFAEGDLIHLAHCEKLTFLSIGRTPSTDRAALHISAIKSLEELGVRQTAITDDGLAYLHQMPNLAIVYQGGSQITAQGRKEFRTISPHIKVK